MGEWPELASHREGTLKKISRRFDDNFLANFYCNNIVISVDDPVVTHVKIVGNFNLLTNLSSQRTNVFVNSQGVVIISLR